MRYKRLVNTNTDIYSRALEYLVSGAGRKMTGPNVKIAKALAWQKIHSWNVASTRFATAYGRELSPQDRRIAEICDYDFDMMYLASALAGIHLDLSEIARS